TGEHGLSGAGGSHDERARTLVEACAVQGIELGNAAGDADMRKGSMVLGGDKPGEHHEAPRLDGIIVVAAAKPNAANLAHPKPATLGTIFERQLLEAHDAVGQAAKLQVALLATIIEKENGRLATHEELLESED